MSQTAAHLEFAPPPDTRTGRALFLALLVHFLLLLALTWGVTWKNNPQDDTVDAELWSTVPEPAAHKPIESAPTPVEPAPETKPVPPPPPVLKKSAPEPAKPNADIAIAVQKKKDLKLKQEQDKQKEQEKALEKEKKLAKQQALAKQQEQEAKESEASRQAQIDRLKNLGDSSANQVNAVTETKSSGRPSDSYLGKLRNKVKPNITFSEAQLQTVKGNPEAVVEVICSPSGQIIGQKLTQSSGNPAWDQAVMAAIEKTGQLPRDENGNIPSRIPFGFRPRD